MATKTQTPIEALREWLSATHTYLHTRETDVRDCTAERCIDARVALDQVEAVVAALREYDDKDCFCEGPVQGTPAQCASCNTGAALGPFQVQP